MADHDSVSSQWRAFPLLSADLNDSLDAKVRAKSAHKSVVVDDMETDKGWSASPAVTLGFTSDRARNGTRSLRFSTSLRNEAYIEHARQPNGSFSGQAVLFDGIPFSASAHLKFDKPQDWTTFNRISLWCYLHPTDNPVSTLSLQFLCEGASAGPTDPIAIHYIGDLQPGEWNLLTWEIPEIRRDRVVEFILFQPISGIPVTGGDPFVTYDFDELTLDRVDAERVAGWEVDPGTISFSHAGYLPENEKIAIISGSELDEFALLESESGRVVHTAPVQSSVTRLGHFGVLDFSDFATPGTFRIRAGDAVSAPFPIRDDAWRELVEATLNTFYGFRCGMTVPGVHDACHLDVLVTDGEKTRVVGGGWHDAANLTQGPGRTHLSIYALLELHHALELSDPELADRALEEARWGIAWSLEMRFGPGRRCLYGLSSYYTDGIRGTPDDVLQDNVGSDTFQNILAVLSSARGARALKSTDPALASRLLRAAEEDFATVLADRPAPPAESPAIEINEGSWRDEISYLTLASVELFRASGSAKYQREAARLARWLLGLQETRFIEGSPITGYFYEDAARTRIVHEYHNSFEESAPVALAALCEAFPDHPDWIEWRIALTTYAEYFCKKGSEAAAPYNLLPAAVWRRTDLEAGAPDDETGAELAMFASPVFPTAPTTELIQSQFQKMFESAAYLSSNQRLRMFPLWYDHVRHGSSTVHLSKNAGLLAAARARGRFDLAALASRQLSWMVGANPFSRSTIYGVGHDWWQNFTASMPNLVGGLSLGFNSYEGDSPAWGNNAVFPYKEMWVFASCRVALNLATLAAPGVITGEALQPAVIRALRTGVRYDIAPGKFELLLEAGEYELLVGASSKRLDVIGGTVRELRVDHSNFVAIELTQEASADLRTITATVTGSGTHTLQLHFSNVVDAPSRVKLHLGQGKSLKLKWAVRVVETTSPWLLVVVPDGDSSDAVEIFGGANQEVDLSRART